MSEYSEYSEYNENTILNDIEHLQNQNYYDYQEIKRITKLIDDLQIDIKNKFNHDKNTIKKMRKEFNNLINNIQDESSLGAILVNLNNIRELVSNNTSNINTLSSRHTTLNNSINQLNSDNIISSQKIIIIESLIDELQTLANNNKGKLTQVSNNLSYESSKITKNSDDIATNTEGIEVINNEIIEIKNKLTYANDRVTRLENNQIKRTVRVDMEGDSPIYKIKPLDNNSFSKILIVDLYGGCILITGSTVANYKSFKAIRLSNGNWESYYPSLTGANKIDTVYYDGSFIYVKCFNYIKCCFEGGFDSIEKIETLPSSITQLPILDLTQINQLTNIYTRLAQLEAKLGGN